MERRLQRFFLVFLLSAPILFAGSGSAHPVDSLKLLLSRVSSGVHGKLGFAMRNYTTGDTLSMNGTSHMVLQSVMKLPIAIAMLHQIDLGKYTLEQKISVSTGELPVGFSRLRDQDPYGAVQIPLRQLISYMISHSDNNACDVLVRELGGMNKVQAYLHSLNLSGISLKADEKTQAKGWTVQYSNWAQPQTLLTVLDLTFRQETLRQPTKSFLIQCLEETTTGEHRLKGLLPPDAYLAHKTGSSATNDEGLTPATNDVGLMKTKNGNRVALVVMLGDCYDNEAERDRVIARIARIVYDYYH